MEYARSLAELTALLPGAAIQGARERTVTGIARDSRAVRPGDLFVCIRGESHDSHRYALDALGKGAVALVVEPNGLEQVGISLPAGTSILRVENTRQALPLLACGFYGDPAQQLLMVGVTGTNGKTTTTRMVASILRAAGKRVGTIGTLGSELDGSPIPSEHTTPEADQLQALLALMCAEGAEAVVMEVSSHAIAQHRTDGIAFNAAIFTNLTQDHLDFHHSMEEYFATKARLFTEYPVRYPRNGPHNSHAPFVSVISVSQPEGRRLTALAEGEILTFSTDGSPATLTAENVTLSAESAQFTVLYSTAADCERFPVRLPIGGAFQVGNALGAIGACLGLQIPIEAIRAGLAQLPPVPGRFEAVPTSGRGFSVIVDYAHTPDGLDNLLRSARQLSPGRIVLVFGCGGDRDRTKRPKMGRLAGTLADIAIVTSDNPRHEEPNAIIAEILPGMDPADPEIKASILVEPDRRTAIQLALSQARPGDILLIAGKGHEDYQIVGDRVLPFDDRKIAAEILAASTPQESERR